MSKKIEFLKLLLVVANLCNLPFFANILVCTVLTDLLIRVCKKIDIHARYTMMHVWNNRVNKKW